MLVEVLVPIVFFLVFGACFIVYFYLRSKERDLIIQKGLTPEQTMSLYNRKKDPLLTLKTGVVVFFFGLGIGLGLVLEETTGYDDAVAVTLFPLLGLGFIVAFFVARKYDKDNHKEENQLTL